MKMTLEEIKTIIADLIDYKKNLEERIQTNEVEYEVISVAERIKKFEKKLTKLEGVK